MEIDQTKLAKRESIERERFLRFARSMYYDGNKISLLETACAFFELLGYDRHEMYLNFLISVKGPLTADIVIGPERALNNAYLVSAAFPICSTEIWDYVKQAYRAKIPDDVTLVIFSPSRIGICNKTDEILYDLRQSGDADISMIYNKLCYWNRV